MPPAMENAHALLIGVGNYAHPQVVDLPATVRDVEAISTALTLPTGGYSPVNVKTLLNEQATASNIRSALKQLAQSLLQQSTIFIYFSGHGASIDGADGLQAYLCPYETNPYSLEHTTISGKEFSDLLAAIPSQKLLVILDACHASGAAMLKATNAAAFFKSGLPENFYEALSQGSGRVIIASSKENQKSYIRPQGDFSLFTWHLRLALTGQAAIRGDGLIHVLDVFHYVNEAVQAENKEQTPILKVKDLDLNFAIALHQDSNHSINQPNHANNIFNIQEKIIQQPLVGAKALSEYLATHTQWMSKRSEVDLKRADLERIEHELWLFGPNDNDKAAKNRVIYFLLRTCLELEQANQ